MKPNQQLLIEKFKIKKTKSTRGKRVKKSELELKKEMYKKMRNKNSVGPKPNRKVCNAYLSEQIKNNVRLGKWSYKQAVAIAYSQTKKNQSGCKKYYT